MGRPFQEKGRPDCKGMSGLGRKEKKSKSTARRRRGGGGLSLPKGRNRIRWKKRRKGGVKHLKKGGVHGIIWFLRVGWPGRGKKRQGVNNQRGSAILREVSIPKKNQTALGVKRRPHRGLPGNGGPGLKGKEEPLCVK